MSEVVLTTDERVREELSDRRFHENGDETRGKIVEYIGMHHEEFGVAPCLRDICGVVGLSSIASAHYHLRILRDAGVVQFYDNMARSVRVLP